jgi:hypothetical protein
MASYLFPHRQNHREAKDECSVFAFEASDEESLKEIKAVLEEEPGNHDRSTDPPVPRATPDVGTIGVIRKAIRRIRF